jgi:hypothetical protein
MKGCGAVAGDWRPASGNLEFLRARPRHVRHPLRGLDGRGPATRAGKPRSARTAPRRGRGDRARRHVRLPVRLVVRRVRRRQWAAGSAPREASGQEAGLPGGEPRPPRGDHGRGGATRVAAGRPVAATRPARGSRAGSGLPALRAATRRRRGRLQVSDVHVWRCAVHARPLFGRTRSTSGIWDRPAPGTGDLDDRRG